MILLYIPRLTDPNLMHRSSLFLDQRIQVCFFIPLFIIYIYWCHLGSTFLLSSFVPSLSLGKVTRHRLSFRILGSLFCIIKMCCILKMFDYLKTMLIFLTSAGFCTARKLRAVLVFGDSLLEVGNYNYIKSLSKADFVPNGL